MDGEAVGDADAGWATISELAELRGVDKSAISRRVTRLAAQGILETRCGKGGTKLVNLAAFDRATEETTDALREANGRAAGGARPAKGVGHVLAHEQARRAAYAADLSKMELDERRGVLMRVDDAHRIVGAIVEAAKRVTAELPARAEENAELVGKNGVAGAREFLRRLARELDDGFADAMEALAERLARATEAADAALADAALPAQ